MELSKIVWSLVTNFPVFRPLLISHLYLRIVFGGGKMGKFVDLGLEDRIFVIHGQVFSFSY